MAGNKNVRMADTGAGKRKSAPANRPRSREKNVTGEGKSVYRRGVRPTPPGYTRTAMDTIEMNKTSLYRQDRSYKFVGDPNTTSLPDYKKVSNGKKRTPNGGPAKYSKK